MPERFQEDDLVSFYLRSFFPHRTQLVTSKFTCCVQVVKVQLHVFFSKAQVGDKVRLQRKFFEHLAILERFELYMGKKYRT
jgi:hypothetical protein